MKKLISAVVLATALLPATAAHASEQAPAPIIDIEDCPEGYVGYIIMIGDRYGVWLCEQLP